MARVVKCFGDLFRVGTLLLFNDTAEKGEDSRALESSAHMLRTMNHSCTASFLSSLKIVLQRLIPGSI